MLGDFFQNGVITTLHRLKRDNLDQLESSIKDCVQHKKIALVLPALFLEFKGPAMEKIVNELTKADYLEQIVISLGKANEEEFEFVKKFISKLPQKKAIIWNDGPRIQQLYKLLESEFRRWEPGKGLAMWMAYGYILAFDEYHVIACHDCDIVTYSRDMLARLCFPIASDQLNYDFCKGYYARVTNKLHGRVTRLFVTPLIRALIKMLGATPFLTYLDSFRYVLAGEFSMTTELAWKISIPADWGLEIGVISEVYRSCALNNICQADLADVYEHKHQQLYPQDPSKGLLKMAIDIAKNLFRNLASDGVVFSEGFFKTLKATYVREAQSALKKYQDDSAINSLYFDRHSEALAVESFANGITIAGEQILKDPPGIPLIPSWSRVISAIPDFFDRLKEAVSEDNK